MGRSGRVFLRYGLCSIDERHSNAEHSVIAGHRAASRGRAGCGTNLPQHVVGHASHSLPYKPMGVAAINVAYDRHETGAAFEICASERRAIPSGKQPIADLVKNGTELVMEAGSGLDDAIW